MQLIICEKEKQAREHYLPFLEKYTGSTFIFDKGAYSNGNITLSYAMGHLVELAPPKMYDERYGKWNTADLPIIPLPFKLVVTESKKRQFSTLKRLIGEADTIYNAADAEREGELIFRLILQLSKPKGGANIKRIWANTYQYEILKSAYEGAKDQAEYQSLYESAKARVESDWLIGINATRMLTVASKSRMTLSLGRVQTAVLRLIVDRYLANKNFTVQDTFRPTIDINGLKGIKFNQTFLSRAEAEQTLKNTLPELALTKTVQKKKLRQPILYSLADLQIECSTKYNYSSAKTLENLQALYEKSLTSYPRTDSNYLTQAQKKETQNALDHFAATTPNINGIAYDTADLIKGEAFETHFIFNDKKTSDHYAIVPLVHDRSVSEKLSEEQKNIFDLILARFVQCFMEPAIIEKTDYKLHIDKEDFYGISGNTIAKEGFLKLSPKKDDILPDLKEGTYKLLKKDIATGKTKPPPLFTEATLTAAMKNPLYHQKITEHKEAVKSLGTPATNHTYLPLLIDRKYVLFEKKNILPTKLGTTIIMKLASTKITSIALTADIEHQIENIKKKKISYDKFKMAIERYTRTLTKEIEAVALTIGGSVEQEKKIPCPSCKKGNLYPAKSKKSYYCSRYKEENPCDFIIFTNIAGRKLSQKNIEALSQKGETPELKFKSKKTGKPYSARIVLDENFKTQLKFNNEK